MKWCFFDAVADQFFFIQKRVNTSPHSNDAVTGIQASVVVSLIREMFMSSL